MVPSFPMVPPLLLGSDLLATLPGRCIPAGSAGSLEISAPPVTVEGVRLDLARHGRSDGDAAVRHVAAEMVAALRPAPG